MTRLKKSFIIICILKYQWVGIQILILIINTQAGNDVGGLFYTCINTLKISQYVEQQNSVPTY